MRILIGLHHVTLGGDTINAVEMAARLNARGHSANLFAFTLPGDERAPLLVMARERGLTVHIFHRAGGIRPRAAQVRRLARLVKDERFDVVHTFGHQDTYFAFLASYGLAGRPMVVNDYAMTLTAGIPRHVPLIVGTQEVLDQARRLRAGPAFLIEPPVDTDENAPGVVGGEAFREEFGVGSDELLLTIVSRLARSMKAEGIRAAVDAVEMLNDRRVRLVVVGDGDAADELRRRAADVNETLGTATVQFAGARRDPRAAYAAADIVLGMGHSGLRAMAFGKPLVVIGERGFTLTLSPVASDHFLHHGIYGTGDGTDMAPGIAAGLRPLLDDPACRAELGRFGRGLVLERFSIDAMTDRTEAVYRQSLGPRSITDWARDAGYLGATYGKGKAAKLRRTRQRA